MWEAIGIALGIIGFICLILGGWAMFAMTHIDWFWKG